LVFAQECLRNGTRIAQSRNRFCRSGALDSLFINHNADDFDVVWWTDLHEHFLAISHLRNGFGRNKANSIDVLETCRD
jgi:hypothetical protein